MHFILALFIVLITYGSLYPFKFSGQALGLGQTIEWLLNFGLHTTKSDIIANILLFVPYGFTARMCINNHRNQLKTAFYYLIGGAIWAFIIQYMQFYLPARVPSSGDALFNSLGIMVGLILSHLLMQYSHNHIPTDIRTRLSWSQVTLPLLLALLWVCWRWFPFIPLVSTESIINGLKPLINQPELDLVVIIRDGIGWLLFYTLCTQPPFDKLPRFRVLKIAFYIIGLEVFIASNELTVNDLLAALGAFALFASIDSRSIQNMLLWSVTLAIGLTWLYPFEFAQSVQNISWLPFAVMLKGNPWLNAEIVILKLYLMGSLILLLRNRWFGWGGATYLCMAIILSFTLLQKYLGDARPDITDTLVVAAIGWAMYQVEQLATKNRTLAMH